MKILKILILLVLVAVFSGALMASGYAIDPVQQPTFEGHEKIGLNLKQVWRRAMQRGDLTEETACMVGTKVPLNRRLKRSLRKAGLKVKTELKTVVTGRIEIGNLPLLVSIDEVKSVDKGERLFLK